MTEETVQWLFDMNSRASGEGRFSICRPDGSVAVSSLDALSTGQLALLQMFATIIRYADTNNVVHSGHLSGIRGIVITSHSPLFLLGMNLPKRKITIYAKFPAAYEALRDDPRCSEWLPELSFDFLGYEPKNSAAPAEYKLGMGDAKLACLCEYCSMLPQKNKKIFISGCDAPEKTKKWQRL